eukprot:COSAG06_NODE_1908_length_8088_cov_2.473526_2_plen_52_part_00
MGEARREMAIACFDFTCARIRGPRSPVRRGLLGLPQLAEPLLLRCRRLLLG